MKITLSVIKADIGGFVDTPVASGGFAKGPRGRA